MNEFLIGAAIIGVIAGVIGIVTPIISIASFKENVLRLLGEISSELKECTKFKLNAERSLSEISSELKEANRHLNTISGNSKPDIVAIIQAINKENK